MLKRGSRFSRGEEAGCGNAMPVIIWDVEVEVLAPWLVCCIME